MLAYNCVEFLGILFTCGTLGAILLPLNWRISPAERGPRADAEPPVLVFGPWFRAQRWTPSAPARPSCDAGCASRSPALASAPSPSETPLPPLELELDASPLARLSLTTGASNVGTLPLASGARGHAGPGRECRKPLPLGPTGHGWT